MISVKHCEPYVLGFLVSLEPPGLRLVASNQIGTRGRVFGARRPTPSEIQGQLQQIFRRHLGIAPAVTQCLVPPIISAAELCEAHVLSRVVERLAIDEGYKLTLVGRSKVQLKSAPGQINRSYPRIELERSGVSLLSYGRMWSSYLSGGFKCRAQIESAPKEQPFSRVVRRIQLVWLAVVTTAISCHGRDINPVKS